jgi:hypothetical protein
MLPIPISYDGPATAYYYEYKVNAPAGAPWRPAVEISQERPTEREMGDEGRGQRGVEELLLDLSGASLRFGITISL